MEKNNLKMKDSYIYKSISIGIRAIIPALFVLNKYAFAIAIILNLFIYCLHYKNKSNLFVVIILNSFIYSCLSLFGLKLYDWIIVIYFIFLLIKKHGKFSFNPRMIILLITSVIVFLFHSIKSPQILEMVRYIISIILVFNVINLEFNFDEIDNDIIHITLANMYNAIVVYILIGLGRVQNISTSIISTSTYIYKGEVRLNGFFTDPNKYMLYCMCLIFIAEIFISNKNKKNIIILLAMISAVISMSRTSLICFGVYFIIKIFKVLRKKSFALFYIGIGLSLIIAIILILNPGIINNLVENIFVNTAKLLGRQNTLKVNTSVENDNRVRIWTMAIQYIKNKPFIGYGWLANEYLLPYPTHNTILSLMLDGGILMLIAYLYAFIPLFRNKRLDVVVPYILIPLFLLDLGNYRLWYLLLGLIIKKGKNI
jgi:O-antigen ligase